MLPSHGSVQPHPDACKPQVAHVSHMACKCVMYVACLGALIACLVLTGTLFVLMKDPAPKQQLLEALASQGVADEEVQELVQQLQGLSPERRPATSVKSQGKWRLLWSMQVCYWCHNPRLGCVTQFTSLMPACWYCI